MYSVVPEIREQRSKPLPNGKNAVPLSAAHLHAGMYIDSEIYIKVNKRYVLFCNDMMLDPALLNKMRNLLDGSYDVYVSEDQYEHLLQQIEEFESIEVSDDEEPEAPEEPVTKPVSDGRKSEVELYKELQSDTKRLMTLFESSGIISKDELEYITNNISDRIYRSDLAVILQCVHTIRVQDDYLYSHSTNVATLNGMIGRWLDFSKEDIDKVIKIGILHDIGKLRIPPEILNKPARLTDEEFEVIKKHPVYSQIILMESGMQDSAILSAVRSHHERNNGMGYPDGLTKREIPLFAKITAVSDVYDAMVAQRPYKSSHSPFEILAEFSRNRFSDLDFHIISVFLENIPRQFIGKYATLTDGRTARIESINPNDLEYPIVSVDKHLVKTSKFLKCVTVDNFTA
jgi:HD-GYP domain-containing protein (c-di-GMP phosphodiesterase class II)